MSNLSSILPQNFKPATYQPSQPAAATSKEFETLPAGTYVAEITGSEIRPLKSGRGTGLTLEFSIIAPAAFARRKIWQTLNVQHDSQMAQDIALGQLAALCRAVGIESLGSEDDLFQRTVKIRTAITPAKGDYPARAEVKGYESEHAAPAPLAATRSAAIRAQSPKAASLADMDSDIPF